MSISTIDVISYAGMVTPQGYEAVCDVLKRKKGDSALLVLATPGGDPHAAFRIARALQHVYGNFAALVPRYCKSAGTLILVGASTLLLDDMSELGPLDVQVKKSDELVGRNSGLDIFQAVNFLNAQAMVNFRNYVSQLTREVGLSTKLASDISVELSLGMLEPIAAQIDPIKLAEMQRATEIAIAYGNRLNEKSGNLRQGGIEALVTGYPSHGFVIDRKEARQVFIRVEKPEGLIAQWSEALHASMGRNISAAVPVVEIQSYQVGNQGDADANANPATPSDGPSPAGVAEREPTVNGLGKTAPDTSAPLTAEAGAPRAKGRAKRLASDAPTGNVAKLRP